MTEMTRRAAIVGLAATAAAATTLPAHAATTHQVIIKGFRFDPADLTIQAGDSVTFTNQDGAPHTATATGFDTGRLKKGASATVKPGKGDHAYACAFHSNMKGVIRTV